MEAIAETLETKLHQWKPETSQKVRALVAEIIALADDDALDLLNVCERVEAQQKTRAGFGLWRGRQPDGRGYVDALRAEWGEPL